MPHTKTDKYILALDQGTTSSRAILFDHAGQALAVAQKEFPQYYPQQAWVEHSPDEIWQTQISVAIEVIAKANILTEQIAAMGITNQRETTLIWDRKTGKPIYSAIVWQDRRTAGFCETLQKEGLADLIQSKTGLVIDAYFSATKIKWLLDNIPDAKQKAEKGELAFGTVDTWLIWKLTDGKSHCTDVSNASRTMLFNIHTLQWDEELLKIFDIPMQILPEVKESSALFGYTETDLFSKNILIAGVAGDQQSALFGQMCVDAGMVKNTYGTGCFMVLNTGNQIFKSKNNLLTTIAWQLNGEVSYALEGSVFIAGAVVQWLRDGLKIIRDAQESEDLANSVEDNGGIFFVPALSGLGSPYWNPYARGTIIGISRGTTAGHIARASLESICFQVKDVLEAMLADTQVAIKELRVDGGAVVNNLLMQLQADIGQFKVVRPQATETTALGVAYFAGLAVGFWKNVEEIKNQWQIDAVFEPKLSLEKSEKLSQKWKKAVQRSLDWVEE